MLGQSVRMTVAGPDASYKPLLLRSAKTHAGYIYSHGSTYLLYRINCQQLQHDPLAF